MRHLILCCALFTGSVTVLSAADDGAFGALVRKPSNSVCVFDGNAVDPSKQPVEVANSAGQPVLVGACSEGCLAKLHNQLGANGYAVAAAATSNTTLAKMQAAAPAALPAPGTLNQPPADPRFATAPAPAPAFPAAPATGGFNPAPAHMPAPGKQDTFGKAHNAPKTVEPAPVDETSPANGKTGKPAKKADKPTANTRGDESDERQREKKAAQRRDAGKPTEDSKSEDKPSSKSSKKPAAKARSEHPAEAPTDTTDTGTDSGTLNNGSFNNSPLNNGTQR